MTLRTFFFKYEHYIFYSLTPNEIHIFQVFKKSVKGLGAKCINFNCYKNMKIPSKILYNRVENCEIFPSGQEN